MPGCRCRYNGSSWSANTRVSRVIVNQWTPVGSWSAPCLSGEDSTSPCTNTPLYPLIKHRTPNDYGSLLLRVLSTIKIQAGRDSSRRGPLGIFYFSGKLGMSENQFKLLGRIGRWGSGDLGGDVVSVFLILRSHFVCSEKDEKI